MGTQNLEGSCTDISAPIVYAVFEEVLSYPDDFPGLSHVLEKLSSA
jgi:hypothetical protein